MGKLDALRSKRQNLRFAEVLVDLCVALAGQFSNRLLHDLKALPILAH
jgi:hypothetical protein